MQNQSFPYPILRHERSQNSDYPNHEFTSSITANIAEEGNQISYVTLECLSYIDHQGILSLIKQKTARLFLDIVCTQTCYRNAFLLESLSDKVQLPADILYDEVKATPMVIIVSPIVYKDSEVNEEYNPTVSWSLNPGDMVAVGKTTRLYLDFDSRKLSSLVVAVESPDLLGYRYKFSVESELLKIFMGRSLYSIWQRSRQRPKYRPFIIMSIVKDCIVFALYEIVLNDAEGKWATSLKEALNRMEKKLPEKDASYNEFNDIAQSFVESKGAMNIPPILEDEDT